MIKKTVPATVLIATLVVACAHTVPPTPAGSKQVGTGTEAGTATLCFEQAEATVPDLAENRDSHGPAHGSR
jgi:hypothetical protein